MRFAQKGGEGITLPENGQGVRYLRPAVLHSQYTLLGAQRAVQCVAVMFHCSALLVCYAASINGGRTVRKGQTDPKCHNYDIWSQGAANCFSSDPMVS